MPFYEQAVERHPLAAWALDPDERAELDEAAERALDASHGLERALREGVRDPRAARPALEQQAGRGSSEAALLLLAEALRELALLDPKTDRDALARGVAHASALARAAAPLGLVAGVGHALLDLASGARAQAEARLARALGAHEEEAKAVVDALERELRTPPHAADAILRRAYYDALLDPFGALEPPRSAFARLRYWIAGGALAVGLFAGAPTAHAHVGDDGAEQIVVDQGGGDEGGGGGGDEGGGAGEGGGGGADEGGGGDTGGGGADEGGGDDTGGGDTSGGGEDAPRGGFHWGFDW